MNTLQIKNLIKMKPHYYITLILLSLALITSCSKDDNPFFEEENEEYPVSYVQFNILGPTHNGNYEYEDAAIDDEFTTVARLYTTVENPDLSEDQIQMNIHNSSTGNESDFLLAGPPETGIYNITYQGGANDFDVVAILTTGESYYAKEVSVNITALELDNNRVTHCKGTFSGAFYRNNLSEPDVHQINGEFEINQ